MMCIERAGNHFAETFLSSCKRFVDNTLDAVFSVERINIFHPGKSAIICYLQHPGQAPEQLSIHTFQICQRHLLLQNHLIETDDEVGIEESSVEDCQSKSTSNELEVVQVLRIYP